MATHEFTIQKTFATLSCDYNIIDSYMEEEKEISIPAKIMGAEVFIIEDYVFDEEADVVILSIPESVIEARFVYHHNSQSYVSVGFDAYDNNSSMLNLYAYYIYSYL